MKTLSRMLLLVFIIAAAGCASDGEVKSDADADATATGVSDTDVLIGDQLVDASGRPLVMRVHFAFDSSNIDSDNRETLEGHAAYLSANPNVYIKLEGHTDERGTREYNLALGERRAKAVARMLAVLGVDSSRLEKTSYGEEKPLDEGHGEAAWKRNRRVEIIY